MGQKFFRGTLKVLSSVASAIPNAISGAMGGMKMGGPWGAAGGAVSALGPALFGGIENAMNSTSAPTGPRNTQETMSMLTGTRPGMHELALMGQGAGPEGAQYNEYMRQMQQGASARYAAQSAGLSPYHSVADAGARQAMHNKAATLTGIGGDRTMQMMHRAVGPIVAATSRANPFHAAVQSLPSRAGFAFSQAAVGAHAGAMAQFDPGPRGVPGDPYADPYESLGGRFPTQGDMARLAPRPAQVGGARSYPIAPGGTAMANARAGQGAAVGF